MKEECIICKAPIIYLEKDEMMECVLCHKKELSKTRCEQGHYVCNECHTKGMDVIIDICLSETSKNPIEIIRRMMAQPFCHMHGPEHHVMVGSALLTAYKNAGGEIDLPEALLEMMDRIVFFYIVVICCQAFGLSAQSVADAGLFTYSAAGTVTASLGGNGVAWGPDAFAVFRNSAQGALADAKVIAGYAVSSWMPGWNLADRHWIHDAGGLFTFGGRQAVLTGVRYLNLPTVELTDEEGNLQSRFTPYALEVDAGYAYAWRGKAGGRTDVPLFPPGPKDIIDKHM